MAKNYFLFTVVLSISILLTACSGPSFEVRSLVEETEKAVLCRENFDAFNNQFYAYWLEKKEMPDRAEFERELKAHFNKNYPTLSQKDLSLILEYYDFLEYGVSRMAGVVAPYEKLQVLTAIEIGDRSTPEREKIQAKLAAYRKQLNAIALKVKTQAAQFNINSTCPDSGDTNFNTDVPGGSDERDQGRVELPTGPGPVTGPGGAPLRNWALLGLNVAVATAYQSCESLRVPAIDERTPDLDGIKVAGKHPDGVGNRREYASVDAIVGTHHYYSQVPTPAVGCVDSRNKPLIYDYGGKPAASSSDSSDLNFFVNSGSGTSVLGVDCSGFIFSALARGGLKTAPEKNLKAVLVYGIAARMFKDPKKNGLTCFDRVTMQGDGDVRPGDVIASNGHVVMVDSVGEDPFGLSRINSIEDCRTNKISFENFDFTIVQSGPYKNAIGIGRAVVKDYLRESEVYRVGLEQYAMASCRAKFGMTSQPVFDELSIARHSGSTNCVSSKKIALRHESCVASCASDIVR